MIALKTFNKFPLGILKSYRKDNDHWIYWKYFPFFPKWLVKAFAFMYLKFRNKKA